MKIKLKLYFLFASLLVLFTSIAQREGIPKPSNPPRLVNNLSKEFPNFITKEQEQTLEQKLVSFSKETSNQIVVIIVDDLNGYEPWDFATEIGYQWKVGQEKEDNGIVLLIKPTGGAGERKTHIAVGRGLEGPIPDLTANRIVENELIPNFKNGDFYKGIDDATTILMKLAKGEINKKDYNSGDPMGTVGAIIIILIIIFIVFALFSKGNNGSRGGGLGRAITYGAMGSMFGSSGGSSSGGSSFGGFGGGSFGGGGSGGSW